MKGMNFARIGRIQMLVFDLDDTLLNQDKVIPESTRTTLHELIDRGITVVTATGRPWRRVKNVVGDLPIHAAICGNGTITVNPPTEEVIDIRRFQGRTVQRLVNFGRKNNLFTTFTYYRPGEEHIKRCCHDQPITARVQDVLRQLQLQATSIEDLHRLPYLPSRIGYIHELETLEAMAMEAKGVFKYHPVYHYHHAGEPVIEILPRGCTKARAITMVANSLGILKRHIMAFGDALNDQEMLEDAGLSIAMEHAPPHIRELCSITIPWRNGEGINNFLRHTFVMDR